MRTQLTPCQPHCILHKTKQIPCIKRIVQCHRFSCKCCKGSACSLQFPKDKQQTFEHRSKSFAPHTRLLIAIALELEVKRFTSTRGGTPGKWPRIMHAPAIRSDCHSWRFKESQSRDVPFLESMPALLHFKKTVKPRDSIDSESTCK